MKNFGVEFNCFNQSLKSMLAKAKKFDERARHEYEIAFQNNNQRGRVYTQVELLSMFPRCNADACGASKLTFLHDENGNVFKYIVVKRYQKRGYIDEHCKDSTTMTGNQIIDEVKTWNMFANDKTATDYFCPVLRFHSLKSDHGKEVSENDMVTGSKLMDSVIEIAQKAVFVGDLDEACKEAERLNDENGFDGQNADERFNEMYRFARKMHWRDVVGNGGNSGVIFDYSKGYYKAVWVDFGL